MIKTHKKVKDKNSTTQSEETTSRQVNQVFEEFLQQVRAGGERFDYRVPIINNTTRFETMSLDVKLGGDNLGNSGGGGGSGNIAMSGHSRLEEGIYLFLHTKEKKIRTLTYKNKSIYVMPIKKGPM